MNPNVRKAGAITELTMAAIEDAAVDLRSLAHQNLEAKINALIGERESVSETKFDEQEGTRSVALYADDADFDDPELEPIGWEEVPMLVIRGTRLFVDDTPN